MGPKRFGNIDWMAGKCVINALYKENFEIGIPLHNYDAMRKILKDAFSDEEYAFFCDCVGLDTPRLEYKEIAAKRNMTEDDVRSRVLSVVKKLKKSRKQLKDLTMTLEELENCALVAEDSKKNSRAKDRQIASLQKEIDSLKRTNLELSDSKEKLTKANDKLDYENGKLEDANARMQEELNDFRVKANELAFELLKRGSLNETVKNAFDKTLHEIAEQIAVAREEFVASLENNSIVAADVLKKFDFSSGAAIALAKAKINSIEELLSCDLRSLTSLVGKSYAIEISNKLKARGFLLRA